MRRVRILRTHACLVMIAQLLAAAQLTGCATSDAMAPREYRDVASASIVTVAGEGTVFSHPRPDYAVHAQDYITIVPVEVARDGRHALYFYSYLWSTVDLPADSGVTDTLQLVADGREIPLAPVSGSLQSVGRGEAPLEPPARDALPLLAPTTREVLQLVMHARDVSMVATRNGHEERYDLWTDGRAAFGALVLGSADGP